MPTLEAFEKYPPFPSDVPIADIPIISYSNLKNNTGHASDTLFEGFREQGFAMLDLRGDEQGERLLKVAESMFDLNTALFKLDKETLLKYKADFPRDANGYKSTGAFKNDGGKRDAIEWYTLSRDDVLGVKSTRQDPFEETSTIITTQLYSPQTQSMGAKIEVQELFTTHREQCQQFFLQTHEVVRDVFAHLDKHLDLPPGTLDSLGPLEKPSGSSLRLLRAHSPPSIDETNIALNGHCDVGTMTVLFNVLGGLQILPAGSQDGWLYVRPQPGCAIINIGDSLVEISGGVLRSSAHRVVSAPGKQANAIRQSLAYPLRAAHDGFMKRLSSSVIPSEEQGKEVLSVDEWTRRMVQRIMDGEHPRTKGGIRY